MNTFNIKYQTADSVPAPFAHAIEIDGKFLPDGQAKITFSLNYLYRETLSEEEIEEEGFSANDDITWQGDLPKIWGDLLFGTLKSSPVLKIDAINEYQDYWQLEFDNKTIFPKNHENWKYLVEELQQAVLENAKIEAPLQFKIQRINAEEKYQMAIIASFFQRALSLEKTDLVTNQTQKKKIAWHELNFILKQIYLGDFIEDRGIQEPKKNGIYVNLGDELWFEVGKGLIVPPSQITKVLGLW